MRAVHLDRRSRPGLARGQGGSHRPGLVGRDLVAEVAVGEPYRWGSEGPTARCRSTPACFRFAALPVVALDSGSSTTSCAGLPRQAATSLVPPDDRCGRHPRHSPDGVFLANGPGDPPRSSTSTARSRDSSAQCRSSASALGTRCSRWPGRHDLQAQVRPPRRQPAGQEPAHRPRRDHLPEPRLLRRLRLDRPACRRERRSGPRRERPRAWVASGVAPVVRSERFGRVQLTHVNLNDMTVEGIRLLDAPAFSVQYHPEAAPGPHDSRYLFDSFTAMMDGRTTT
jgi:carbamoyl-phosphate synthase small subunit